MTSARRRRCGTAGGTALLLTLACGCSYIDVRKPPRPVPVDVPVDCTDSLGLPIADTAFAVGGVALAGYAHLELKDDDDPAAGAYTLFAMLPGIVVAIMSSASAVYGYTSVSACERAKREQGEAREEQEQVRERAWALTKAAALAARDGNCVAVLELEAEVRALDAEFHRTVFVRDTAVARCITVRWDFDSTPAKSP